MSDCCEVVGDEGGRRGRARKSFWLSGLYDTQGDLMLEITAQASAFPELSFTDLKFELVFFMCMYG